MNKRKLLCSLMLLAGFAVSNSALADRGYGGHGHSGHFGMGLYFGVPYPYSYYPYPYPYAYPYDYYPPVVVTPPQTPVYIEQGNPPPASQSAPQASDSYYWYHCDKPEGYYPYVKECPSGWQKVTPTPPTK